MQLGALPPSDEPALIGVSGGRDSVALLHALVARGHRSLIVCYLDHQLRPESTEEAAFVAALAARWGLTAVIARDDVRARVRRTHRSLETAAREARHGFFAEVARERGVHRLLLAHHADDQAETFLFNLLRGAGMTGLRGMRPISTREFDGVPIEIFRPLLGVWRKEIDAYVTRHCLEFREDASNADPRHTRNRMRHEIIPQIEAAFGREVRHTLWRTAEILAAEEEWIAARPELATPAAELAVAELRALPLALQRRLLHGWLKAGGTREIGFEEIESVRSLLTGARAKVNLAGGWHARRRAGHLFLERPAGAGHSP